MWRSLIAAVTIGASFSVLPAFADHEDDWDGRDSEWQDRRKGKRKERGDEGYYVYYYYRPGERPAPSTCECAVSQPPAASREQKSAPEAFPRESAAERTRAGQRQRGILEAELEREEELLALAKRELAERRAGLPRDGRSPPGGLRPFEENVELHERNVAALRRELHLARR